MENTNPNLKATKPKSIFNKPLEVDYKGLIIGLTKGISHAVIGKWEEIATDTVESLSALGLSTEPEELAFLLINRSIIKATFDLIGESACRQLIGPDANKDSTTQKLDSIISHEEIYINCNFLDRPAELPVIKQLQGVLQFWLEEFGIDEANINSIVNRLPSYFIYALNQEWRHNAKTYLPLVDALNTPFTQAGEREWAWSLYFALLQRRILESIFDEPFSLRQIYIPLNAYYLDEKDSDEQDDISRSKRRQRMVVSLTQELEQWLEKDDPIDTIKVISGGPGSGKSSFARIFAVHISSQGRQKVLFVPLHLIDTTKDLIDEIGRFVKDEGVLLQNPVDAESPEPNLLIIFDGLDELASQGKIAAETARAFIREVNRMVEKRNLQRVKLRILISGRELVVQENESEFRHSRQVLSLLPYYIPSENNHRYYDEGKEYCDPEKLLDVDLRQTWWTNFGLLTGKAYKGLPIELERKDLEEITTQPLLNYLLSLSFTRNKLDFTKDININSIYADLVDAVHERGYEKHRIFMPIRHMKFTDFVRVLEEIGLAAWHGDGRTTTVKAIEEHCRASGVGSLLDSFQEGAQAGVTRLLAAFFFRQYGQSPGGDQTFIFTHKSFGEYLAARRIVRAIDKIVREVEKRSSDPDDGWDERDALKYWTQICGPSAISPYIHTFLLNEMELHKKSELAKWQDYFTKLFSYLLRNGLPLEQFQIPFKKALFQSRNAEEALLVALNACARITRHVSLIEHPDETTFGAWFKRIQGQRPREESAMVMNCLSYLDLENTTIQGNDFFGANLQSGNFNLMKANLGIFAAANLARSSLIGATLIYSTLIGANLKEADLQNADLRVANLEGANFEGANLVHANLERANLERANFEGANLEGANLEGANLIGIHLKGAHLKRTRLIGVNLQKIDLRNTDIQGAALIFADLEGAHLEGAHLEGAHLDQADLDQAHLEGAHLEEAYLEEAYLEEAHLEGAHLEGAHLEGAHLVGAHLVGAYLEGVDLEGTLLDMPSIDNKLTTKKVRSQKP